MSHGPKSVTYYLNGPLYHGSWPIKRKSSKSESIAELEKLRKWFEKWNQNDGRSFKRVGDVRLVSFWPGYPPSPLKHTHTHKHTHTSSLSLSLSLSSTNSVADARIPSIQTPSFSLFVSLSACVCVSEREMSESACTQKGWGVVRGTGGG